MAAPTTKITLKKISTNNNKISNNSHQVFQNIHRKRSVLKSLSIKFQVFSLQLYQKRDSDAGVFLWNYYKHIFLSSSSGKLLLEEPKILLKTVSIAIPNDISEGYYQNGFVICFLRSTYGRFMEFLIETYNKGFSCSWIFSASWALPNA